MNGYKIPLLLLALIGITRKSKHIQRFGIRNGYFITVFNRNMHANITLRP